MSKSNGDSVISPREMVDRVLTCMLDIDMAGFGDLYAEDGVLEQPYSSNLAMRRLEGREAIRSFLIKGQAATPLKLEKIDSLVVHTTGDPEIVIFEFDGYGSVSTTGGTYKTAYLELCQVRDGEIVFYRHYAESVVALIEGTRQGNA